ncbi:hypothetical protein LTR66_005168 [Elasticomyces elasticus]|nr:hypothetical protein LTR66_005168 [Elasticomyces elasticus]
MSQANNDITGRLVLITGASGGIGSACAAEFAKHGCDLALTYSSNKESAEALKHKLLAGSEKETTPLGNQLKVTIHKVDLASPEETTKLCEGVQKEHGRAIDILISNAGYGKRIRDVSFVPLPEIS